MSITVKWSRPRGNLGGAKRARIIELYASGALMWRRPATEATRTSLRALGAHFIEQRDTVERWGLPKQAVPVAQHGGYRR
jgi:hypothetical protein